MAPSAPTASVDSVFWDFSWNIFSWEHPFQQVHFPEPTDPFSICHGRHSVLTSFNVAQFSCQGPSPQSSRTSPLRALDKVLHLTYGRALPYLQTCSVLIPSPRAPPLSYQSPAHGAWCWRLPIAEQVATAKVLSRCSDNAGSLTHGATRELLSSF